MPADLVIDAMGRRSKLADWLQAIGGRPPHVESEDSGFVYYTRYFKGPEPPATLGPVLAPIGTLSLLTLVSDNGTWSVTLFGASDDVALRRLREPEAFTAVVRACPLQAHWLNGEPITDIVVMAGILDKYRGFRHRRSADRHRCGRRRRRVGLYESLSRARDQRRHDPRSATPRRRPGGPRRRRGLRAPLRCRDGGRRHSVLPKSIASDRARIAEMNALRAGAEPPPPDPGMVAIGAAMLQDADVFRGMIEVITCLALPQEVFTRPALQAKISEYVNETPMTIPAPSRDELLQLIR